MTDLLTPAGAPAGASAAAPTTTVPATAAHPGARRTPARSGALMALVAIAVTALVTGRGPGSDTSLASQIAFKQRCAVRYPDPCWRDPLTEAYGRGLAGAIRALAPAPLAQDGLVGVDYRRCRQVSCATWAGRCSRSTGSTSTAS